jgi:hypothetical protein
MKGMVFERAIPGRESIDARSGDGPDGRRRIGRTPAEGDVGTDNAPRAPPTRRFPRSRTRAAIPRSERASLLPIVPANRPAANPACSPHSRPIAIAISAASRPRHPECNRRAGPGGAIACVANHSSRVEPADACFRDCISAAWQLLTVAPMLRPRRAMCVRHRLLAVVRTKVGKHWIAPRLMLCLWKQRCCSSNTDFEHHRLSHRPGDAAVSRPTTRRALVVVQTDSVVECRGRGWSRRRSGSRRAPAARPALLPCLPHPSALAGTWHVELRRGEPAGVALAIRPQRGVSHP